MNKNICLFLIVCILLPTIVALHLPNASSQQPPYVKAEKTISPQRVRVGENVRVTIKLTGAGGKLLTPVDVMMVLDRSGSMTGQKIEDAKDAAKALLEFTDQEDRVGLVTYSSGVKVDFNLQSMNPVNKEALKTAIDQLKADGMTNIYDAMVKANNLLLASPRANVPLIEVLLTDGRHNYPKELPDSTFEALAKDMKDDRIIVFTVGLGVDVSAARLRMIAETTGGRYFFAPTSTELKQIFEEIGGILQSAGTNIVVTERIPSYMTYGQDASKPPDDISSDGETTVVWKVGSLMVGEEWQVTYSAQAREAVEVNSQAVQGKVEYITIQSTPTSTELTPGVVYHSLAVTLLTVKPRKFTKGDIVDITATVKNKGGVQDTFKVRITSNDTLLSSQTMTLSSGQLRNVTFSWNTSNVGYAKYKVAVVIDPDEQVWEEDRSDNRAAVMVEVIAPARGGPSFVYFIILLLLILLTIIVVVAVSSVAGSERRPRRLSWLVTRQS